MNNRAKPSNSHKFILIKFLLGVGSLTIFYGIALQRASFCARAPEAELYISAMNRAQQAYYIEKGVFTNELPKLGLSIRSETENYSYAIKATEETAFNYAIPKKVALRAYVGGVFLEVDPETEEKTTFSILFKATAPGKIALVEPKLENGVPICLTGSEQI